MLMKAASRPLQLLAAGLRGDAPNDEQWSEVLEVANRGWLGPALYISLARASRLEQIPTAVRDYLGFLHELNRERNRRLRAQLVEAVAALNQLSIEPILLKGAVHLFCAPDESLGSRMMSDLDLCVDAAEMLRARGALAALGYRAALDDARAMGRPDDVGCIELRDKPSSRTSPYLSSDLRSSSSIVEHEGAKARVPSPTCRALHLIVHDMIKEGDYWRWRTDLRHLHDLAELAATPEGIDWRAISAAMSDRVARRALALQVTALNDIFGVAISPGVKVGRMTRLRHAGRVTAGTRGPIGAAARALGDLTWVLHRLVAGPWYEWRGVRDFAQRVYRTLGGLPRGAR
jgi:hypothetical protein